MNAAYVAGILDGEGCLTVGWNKRSRTCDARVQVGMTAKALSVLERLHAEFGGTLRLHREQTEKWEAAWIWGVSGKAAAALLVVVLPHLSLKVRQARLLLELEEMKPGGRNSWTEAMRQRAAAIRATVLELNQKGPSQPPRPSPLTGAVFVRDVDGFLMQPRPPDLFDEAEWEPWSGPWLGSGISGPGGFWTAAGSECPNDGAAYSACSLADVLEPCAAPKYSLSARAAAGILRRAAKRGRELPPQLKAALLSLAGEQTAPRVNESGARAGLAPPSTPGEPCPTSSPVPSPS